MPLLHDIMRAITVDEVGIHSARIGPLLLKTAYQPVYARDGDLLTIAAMSSSTRALLAGQPVRHAFLAAMTHEERQRAFGIGYALGVLNRVNIDGDVLPVILSAAEGARALMVQWPHAVDELSAQISLGDQQPGQLICQAPHTDFVSLEDHARFAAECRRYGFDLSIGGFSGTMAAVETIRATRPEIVSLDANWFEQIAASPMAAKLLPALLRSIKGVGSKIHVLGIDNPATLSAALEAGADLFQGPVLALPALAGASVDRTAVAIADAANSRGNVVSLFG